jgi:hypothetical protein
MKLKYSVDNNNQLLITTPCTKKTLKPKGKFGITKNNQLFYKLNESSGWRKQYALPPRIIFKGSWQLNPNHDLMFILDKRRNQFQADTLTLKGDIVSLERDLLAFELKCRDQAGLLHIQILRLEILLFADESNRICLKVEKLKPDILILTRSWQINNNQQVIYEYEKRDVKTKTRISHLITFCGFWQISAANRLTYILKHSSNSRFDFKAQVETPTIYPQKGLIKYRLGFGVKEDKLENKLITLYGAWKFSRNLGLIFEMDYGKDGIKQIGFAADVSFQKNTITFSLKDKDGEPLGLTLTLSHNILKSLDAEAFLRLKKLSEDSRIEAGLKIPF